MQQLKFFKYLIFINNVKNINQQYYFMNYVLCS